MGCRCPTRRVLGLRKNIGWSGAKILARIGRCGDRHVKGAKRALGHTLGGMGAVSSVSF